VQYIDAKAAKRAGRKSKNLTYDTDSEDENEKGFTDKDCLKIMLAGNVNTAFDDDDDSDEELEGEDEEGEEEEEVEEEMNDEIYFPNERVKKDNLKEFY